METAVTTEISLTSLSLTFCVFRAVQNFSYLAALWWRLKRDNTCKVLSMLLTYSRHAYAATLIKSNGQVATGVALDVHGPVLTMTPIHLPCFFLRTVWCLKSHGGLLEDAGQSEPHGKRGQGGPGHG